ncbi:carbonic anhydrase 2-like isoform X1 [Branchiostoma floridae x Branchiostoma belcheri]
MNDKHQSESRHCTEWNYCGQGPSKWHEQFPVAKGQRQSPIDIVTDKVVFDQTLSDNPLKISYSNNCCQSVTNTGASFQVAVDGAGTEISGGPLDSSYKLVQFHAHWGHGGNEGSEHTVDGVTYPAELHLVHWNTKYKDVTEAVDKPDGLAVIGIFFTEGKEHSGFKPITDMFSKVPRKTDKVDIKFKFDPACLLPAERNYWTYLGSLTTPPLFESVTWFVMKDPVEVSAGQLAALRSLLWETPSGEGQMGNNYRPPQPLQGRLVKASFTEETTVEDIIPAVVLSALAIGVGAIFTISMIRTKRW